MHLTFRSGRRDGVRCVSHGVDKAKIIEFDIALVRFDRRRSEGETGEKRANGY